MGGLPGQGIVMTSSHRQAPAGTHTHADTKLGLWSVWPPLHSPRLPARFPCVLLPASQWVPLARLPHPHTRIVTFPPPPLFLSPPPPPKPNTPRRTGNWAGGPCFALPPFPSPHLPSLLVPLFAPSCLPKTLLFRLPHPLTHPPCFPLSPLPFPTPGRQEAGPVVPPRGPSHPPEALPLHPLQPRQAGHTRGLPPDRPGPRALPPPPPAAAAGSSGSGRGRRATGDHQQQCGGAANRRWGQQPQPQLQRQPQQQHGV